MDNNDDILEIEVWGDSGDDGGLTIYIEKAKLREAANGARDAAVLAGTAGAAVLGASGGNPWAIAIAAALFTIALELILIAVLLNMLALDPPRAEYKVEHLAYAPVSAGLGHAAVQLDDAILTSRSLFDWLELWQGAREAGDAEWAHRHAVNVKENYIHLREKLLTAIEAVYVRYADLRGLLDSTGLDMRQVSRANANMTGRKLSEVSGARSLIDGAIDWQSPVLDGFSDEARAEADDLIIQRFERGQLRASLANLWNVARTL